MGSYITYLDARFIESIYQKYGKSPHEVEPSLRHFFAGMPFATTQGLETARQNEDSRISALIRAYRKGHQHVARSASLFWPVGKCAASYRILVTSPKRTKEIMV